MHPRLCARVPRTTMRRTPELSYCASYVTSRHLDAFEILPVDTRYVVLRPELLLQLHAGQGAGPAPAAERSQGDEGLVRETADARRGPGEQGAEERVHVVHAADAAVQQDPGTVPDGPAGRGAAPQGGRGREGLRGDPHLERRQHVLAGRPHEASGRKEEGTVPADSSSSVLLQPTCTIRGGHLLHVSVQR